jgi:predicted Zn-ribbon and HTH transcriptional regulator
MALNDYQCKDCGREFTLVVEPGLETVYVCPNCKSDHIEECELEAVGTTVSQESRKGYLP